MNQENKKQVIIAAILGVVLVLVLIYQFAIKGGGTPPPASTAAGTAASAPAPRPSGPPPVVTATRLKKVDVNLEELQEKVQEVTFRYETERISRSPMTPLVGRIRTVFDDYTQSGPSNVYDIAQKSVTGIIYNQYKPLAVIDDEVVSEGHQYPDGVVLTKIEPKRVWFKWGDNEIPVELKEL